MADTRGHIRKRGNGYQVIVYAGRDPVTQRKQYWRDSARTWEKALATRDRLVQRVDDAQDPEQRATVGVLLDRWLELADLEISTRHGYEGYIRRNIRPAFGDTLVRKVRPHTLDAFYGHLRRCSKLCDGQPYVEHRRGKYEDKYEEEHGCAKAQCQKHTCRPLKPSTVRQIHSILARAFVFAVKWGWVDSNPTVYATPPRLGCRDVDPPTSDGIAKVLEEARAFAPDFEAFLWIAMVTGARRGEVCALRWGDIDWDDATLWLRRNYVTKAGRKIIKETKTHQARRLSLDDDTLAVLGEHRDRCRELAHRLGGEPPEHFTGAFAEPMPPHLGAGYIFCRDGLGADPWLPDTVTHQFARIAGKAGLDDRLHDLRHFNATELLAAGVDLRTVAGRLGHSGGGATTLKVYAHFARNADQRAAQLLSQRVRRRMAAEE